MIDCVILTARRFFHAPEETLRAMILYSLRDKLQLQRFSVVSGQYSDFCGDLDPRGDQSDRYASGSEGYDWKRNANDIRNSFKEKVPLGFLSQPTISATMVYRGNYEETRKRIDSIISVWPATRAVRALREDYIGLPRIVDFRYATSSNRVHHAYHLVSYEATVKKAIDSWDSILEWGGGYGDMARLIRRLNNKCTYTIVDVPELCALQYVYLFSLLGEEVNLVIPGRQKLMDEKINIVPVGSVLREEIRISAQSFISTWGLTECPIEAQRFVCERSFFGAESILLGYSLDRHNMVKNSIRGAGYIFKPIRVLSNGHEYAFM